MAMGNGIALPLITESKPAQTPKPLNRQPLTLAPPKFHRVFKVARKI
jgi:hypothetical protein